MFSQILVPLDGSMLSEGVIPHVLSLSKAFNAEVTLVQVVESSTGTTKEAVDPLEWEMSKAEAETYLDGIREQLEESGLDNVKTTLLEGEPAQRIIELLEAEDFELVVLSSHGRSGLRRWNISSVVRKVIQCGKCSVMIVRAYIAVELEAPAGARYSRLFVPLDGSIRAEYALDIAVILSRFSTAALVVGHVIARPEMPLQVPLTKGDQTLIERYVKRVKDAIQEYFDSLQTRIPIEFETRLRISDEVAITLHEMVEAENIDLVVLGAHGHTGKKKWPFGGITTSFIEYGTTPLLIVQDLKPNEVEPTKAEQAAEESQGH